jgi:choice-of-anchor B domain-containing protein
MRKTSILLAAVACLLAFAGTASAHPVPGGMSFGLYSGWFTLEDQKLRDLASAANQPQAAQGARSADCVNGMAGEFPCDDVNMLGNLSLAEIGGGEIGNDIWGWTDPSSGREIAIMGKTNGTAFVDVTDGENPQFLGMLPTQTDGSRRFWRDIKVYRNHAFIVSEHIGHNMQVFDLTRLRGVGGGEPQTFTADKVYEVGGAGNTHNLDINERTGYAYLVGTSTCAGGLHMVHIKNPTNPKFAGCFAQDGYTHDTQCEKYSGPDKRFRNREICFASNEDTVTIVDVTDKEAPRMISRTGYPTAAYTHQGWLTADGKWFVFNDELDELDGTAPE